jgi:hypothetical protein
MALPSTGSTQAVVLEPSLNPLNTRYWQVVYVLVRDYYKSDGTVFNLADPSVGLGSAGVFTPFAADNISIRSDLLVTSPGTNQGFFTPGLLKPDSVSLTPDQTMTETPSAQLVRTSRNVLQKLDDKIMFEPIESNPVVDYLQYELPLVGGVPALGTPGYQLARANLDSPVERIMCFIGIDGDGQLISRTFPHVVTDKKGKSEFGRKAEESSQLTYCLLPDPYSKAVEWKNRAGSQWLGSGDFDFLTTQPVVTPVTGLKANVVFPTPIDLGTIVYSASTQLVANGSLTSNTLTSTTGTVAGGFTTIQLTALTANQLYNGVQVTATGSTETATGPISAPFTATAS